MTSSAPLIERAARALALLRSDFSQQVTALANACAIDGVLDAGRMDQAQVASYEIAFASAELLAAQTALEKMTTKSSELDVRLALTWTAEAIVSVADRLRLIALDTGVEPRDSQAVWAGDDAQALCHEVSSGKGLDATGRLLLDCEDEFGMVELSDELLMVRDEFRRFAFDVVAPIAADIHRADLTVPESVLEPLREMGVFGLSIPEKYGGSAANDHDDALTMIVITEALSEASLAAAGSLITRPEILSRALLAGGTPAQLSVWLPRIARGDPLCAIAITEPGFGSDVAGVQLRATQTGGGWILNGAKTWCTFAGKAGLIMVVARTASDRALGHKGLSILLVEKPAYDGHEFDFRQPGGGRLVGKAIATIGYRGMHSFDLAFENFFVPDANVVGEAGGLGKGFYFTMAGMTGGRMQTAARASGVMRAAIGAALRYARDRKVFGATLGSYSLTRSKLARMAARFAACRHLTYEVGRLQKAGRGGLEASLIKLFACRSAEWVTREGLQIHGGMGYAEESAISRYFVDARVLSIFEGAEETLALKVIARGLLENVLKSQPTIEAA